MWWILIILCCWENLGLDLQRLHMIGDVIIVQGNGIVTTIYVNKKLRVETKRPQILVCYDLMEGLTNEKEDLIFETKLELFSIGTITISF